mmetsp:Transcript_30623/g.49805  ORF Transcript_30623/g.49805 Transcript_30623/m.49805 type:complete len:227 (-) Transcript_30623:179-859(-)
MSASSKKRPLPNEESSAPKPPEKKRRLDLGLDADNFSIWHLYCNGEKLDIMVHKNTSLAEIRENIRDITGIQQFRCKNENGFILFLSSNLPNNMNIFVDDLAKQQLSPVPRQPSHDHDQKSDQKSNVERNINESSATGGSSSESTVLKIILLGDNDPLRVKVKPTTSWSKIFESFANYKGKEQKNLRFCYDGYQIRPNLSVGDIFTPIVFEHEEIQIDVLLELAGS